jgi:hypothetical protein
MPSGMLCRLIDTIAIIPCGNGEVVPRMLAGVTCNNCLTTYCRDVRWL